MDNMAAGNKTGRKRELVEPHKSECRSLRDGDESLSQWASAFEKSIRWPRKRFSVPFLYNGGAIVCVLDYTSLWFVLKRNESKIDRRLAVPLEDLSTGWKQAGQVGQEVYGSSVSFLACASSYLNYANASVMVFSEYPILEDKGQFASDGSGTIEMRLSGTPDFSCKVRVLAKGSMELLRRVTVETKTNKAAIAPTQTLERSFTEYQVAGRSELRITVASRERLPLV